MKTINVNPLGDTQREQWHSVVNILRRMGGDMTAEGRAGLCDELDRYIDYAEDIRDEIKKQADPSGKAERMTAEDAITIMERHIGNWRKLEQQAAQDNDYHSAQSYADMAYAGSALKNEIERELYHD